MQLSDGEKLILVMLSEIYKHHGINGEIDPELVLKSIFNDKLWGLKWEYGGLFNTHEDNPAVVQETCDILNMYRWLTPAFKKLSDAEKARVRQETTHWADYVEFKGFDANNDDHFGVVNFLVNDLGRYEELKDKYLNSHSVAELRIYRCMLEVFKGIDRPERGLSADQIISMLNADKLQEEG